MMDYEVNEQFYNVKEYSIFSSKYPFKWIKKIREYYNPSSCGDVLYLTEEQTEPFGEFKELHGVNDE